MFEFENESVWYQALELADHLTMLANFVAKQDQASLAEPIRRNGINLATDIAAACGTNNPPREGKYYYQAAEINLYKLTTLIKILLRREYITIDQYKRISKELESMAEALSRLYNRNRLES